MVMVKPPGESSPRWLQFDLVSIFKSSLAVGENLMSTFASRKKSSFRGDITRLVSGIAIAQGIGILFAPIVTRLYAPEAYGLAAMFASIASILAILACLRYEIAICLPEKDEDGANLLGICFLSTFSIVGVTCLIVLVAGRPLLEWLNMPELLPYLWLVPVAVGLHGIFTALNYWNTRTKHFSRLSIAKVTAKVGTTGTVLGAGFSGHATGGSMIWAGIVGSSLSTLVLGGQIMRDNGTFFFQKIRWRAMKPLFSRYKKFPLISLWSAFLNNASWKLPALMLGAFFSPAVVGFYALGFTIIQMPMSLVGGAISQVFLQKAAAAKRDGTLPGLVEKLFALLLATSLAPLSVLAVSGEVIFSCIFGHRWLEAGTYAQILAVWAAVWFVSSPLSMLFNVLERQGFGLKINIMIFLSRFLSIAVGGWLQDVKIALWLFSFSGILVYGYLCVSIMLASGVSYRKIFYWVGVCSFIAIPCCVSVIMIHGAGVSDWTVVVFSAFVALVGLLLGALIAKKKDVFLIV